jgi:hypothetical protein
MVDPLLQMRRQVDSALHAAGQLSASDFLSLLDAPEQTDAQTQAGLAN